MKAAGMRKALVAVLAGAALALTGCSASVSIGGGDDTTETSASGEGDAAAVGRADLEEESARQLAVDPGSPPEIRCAGDLEGRVGATQTCEVRVEGEWTPYTATVTSVDGTRVRWDIRADGAPAEPVPADEPDAGDSVARATVEAATAEQLNAGNPGRVVTVDCPGDLPGRVGATMDCRATAQDGETATITLTVTSVVGDDVNWDIALAE